MVLRDLTEKNQALKALQMSISYVKNCNDFTKISFLHEFSLMRTDQYDQLAVQVKESGVQAQQATDELVKVQKALQAEVQLKRSAGDKIIGLEAHIEWTKKRSNELAKKNGTLNFTGILDEIYQYKQAIDTHVIALPTIDGHGKSLRELASEMEALNVRFVEIIDKLLLEEERMKRTVTTFPVLRQLETTHVRMNGIDKLTGLKDSACS